MKKFKFLFLIVLLITIGALFASCSGGNEYNPRGTATVTITLSQSYSNASVSCPEGTVTQSGNMYKVALQSRKTVDVLVSAPGYETVTEKFTTKEFNDNNGILSRSVTLDLRMISLFATVSGMSDIENIEVKNDKGLIDSYNIENKKVRIDLKRDASVNLAANPDYDFGEFTFTYKGTTAQFFPNSLSIGAGDLINYSANFKIPMLRKGLNKFLITVVNDMRTDTNSHQGFNYRTYNGYDWEGVNIGSSDTLIEFDTNENYVLGENNYILSSRFMKEQEEAETPYLRIKLSEIGGQYWGGDSFNLKFKPGGNTSNKSFTGYFFNENYGHDINNHGSAYYGSAEWELVNIQAGKTYLINVSITDSNTGVTDPYMFYRHTVTQAEVQSGRINLREDYIEDDIKVNLNFFDISGGAGIEFDKWEITSITPSCIEAGSKANQAIINLSEMVKDGITINNPLFFGTTDGSGLKVKSGSYILCAIAVRGGTAAVNYDAPFDWRIKLTYNDGTALSDLDFQEIYGGYLDYSAGYLERTDTLEGELFYLSVTDMSAIRYLNIQFPFSKEIFEYDSDDDCYYYTVSLIREYEITLSFETTDSHNMLNILQGYDRWIEIRIGGQTRSGNSIDEDGTITVTVRETHLGASITMTKTYFVTNSQYTFTGKPLLITQDMLDLGKGTIVYESTYITYQHY